MTQEHDVPTPIAGTDDCAHVRQSLKLQPGDSIASDQGRQFSDSSNSKKDQREGYLVTLGISTVSESLNPT